MITEKPIESKMADLGWCIARLVIGEGNKSWKDCLTIVSPEAVDRHTVQPAQSINIQGLTSLKALQKLLNDSLPPMA